MTQNNVQMLEKLLNTLGEQLKRVKAQNGHGAKSSQSRNNEANLKQLLFLPSPSQAKLLREIAESPTPVPASRFMDLARRVGYKEGRGASACFRGRHPSLSYRVEKYLVVTKRGMRLLREMEAHTNQKPNEEGS